MAVERLQKILSNAGVASRREAEEMIVAGRVAVNGVPQTELGARADLEQDEVTVDGVPVVLDRYRYFLLNKPAGFVTTADDELGRETVLDLVPIGDVQLHPVGRLDKDSEGLLLITNDGHLTDLLTHPRYEVEKEYLVGIDAPLSRTDVQRLVRGVESGGDRLRAVSAQQALAPEPGVGEEPPEAPAWVLLVLREGKNRAIRRMMKALGREVLMLRRIRLGPVHLGQLGKGSFRELTSQEVSALYNAAKQAEARAATAEETEAARGTRTAPARGGAPSKGQPRGGGQNRVGPAAAPKPRRTPGAGGPPGQASRGPARPGGKSAGGPQRGAFGGRPTQGRPGPKGEGSGRSGGRPSSGGGGGRAPKGDAPRGGSQPRGQRGQRPRGGGRA